MPKVTKPKKDKIIKSAIAVFAEKGFRESTLSDLAKKAGISEATLYNHFRNKEEILFSIPVGYMNDFMAKLEEQFTGIKNSEEKLRKFVWQLLWWSQKHQSIIKILLLEIQPHLHYGESEVHQLVRQIGNVLTDILNEGKSSGTFRAEVNPRIFRKFLIGTIDYLFLTRIALDRPFQPLDDYDSLADAFVAAIKSVPIPETVNIDQIEKKRERILLAAEDLLTKKSYVQISISEIAKNAGVAEGTIYEYFKNKEDVLFSLYENHMKDYCETFAAALHPEKTETKLKHVLWHFLSWAESQPRWAMIYLRDIIPNPRFYRSEKHKVMRNHVRELMQIFEEGRETGVFRIDLDPYLLRGLVFGPLHAMGYNWSSPSNDHKLDNDLDDLYDLIFRAIKNPE
ncbi:TetR/AcrR family transcriptional regulator [bacterium]|nr:TetR/AcrR family transcriptional regulator [bacterium]